MQCATATPMVSPVPPVKPAPRPPVYRVVTDARGPAVPTETTHDLERAIIRARTLSRVYWCECSVIDEQRNRIGTARKGFWYDEVPS